MRDCHGICSRFKSTRILRPIYKYHRRCIKCEITVGRSIMICACCKCQTRGRPRNRKYKEKYIRLNYS